MAERAIWIWLGSPRRCPYAAGKLPATSGRSGDPAAAWYPSSVRADNSRSADWQSLPRSFAIFV